VESECRIKGADAIAIVVAGKAGVVFGPTWDFLSQVVYGALFGRWRRGAERRADCREQKDKSQGVTFCGPIIVSFPLYMV
jgi:hypothetical protein